jgi:hypothetical protein
LWRGWTTELTSKRVVPMRTRMSRKATTREKREVVEWWPKSSVVVDSEVSVPTVKAIVLFDDRFRF